MLITVIVPIYNAEAYLDECLKSIVSQHYGDLEIILVNDGSTDGSTCICEKFADRDPRIRIITQENQGLVSARKVGIRAASGEYISFVDADDYIDLDMYSKLAQAIDGDLPDIVTFGHIEEYEDHSVVKKDAFEAGEYGRRRIESEVFSRMLSNGPFFDFGMLPNIWCKLIKKSFLESCDLRVSNNVMIGEDADLFFQVLPQANSLKILDTCPYHYRKYETSMMQKGTDMAAIDSLQNDLNCAFKRLGISDIMQHQLDEYITFIRLLKAPQSIPFINKLFSEDKRFALYGAGGFGKSLYSSFGDKISLWADSAYDRYSESNIPIVSPQELMDSADKYDVIFIAILKAGTCEKIKQDLSSKGVSKPIVYCSMPSKLTN